MPENQPLAVRARVILLAGMAIVAIIIIGITDRREIMRNWPATTSMYRSLGLA